MSKKEDAADAADLETLADLIRAGMPVCLLRPAPNPDGTWNPRGGGKKGRPGTGYRYPGNWPNAVVELGVLETWRPGMGVIGVTGHAVDVLDADPRNGGDVAYQALLDSGIDPTIYGIAATPSTPGRHYFIAPLRIEKTKRDGIDILSGLPSGDGRGNVFLAPTKRLAKDGVIRRYGWLERPFS